MEFNDGDRPESALKTDLHWMKRAFGLSVEPSPSTRLQSDQVLSGEPVLPLRVYTWMSCGVSDFKVTLPQLEIASVSRTLDS